MTEPTIRRIKVLIGYAAHARFSQQMSENPVGSIPRTIAQPYRYSPEHLCWEWEGKPVFIAETAHRRYEVYEVVAGLGPVPAE